MVPKGFAKASVINLGSYKIDPKIELIYTLGVERETILDLVIIACKE